MKQSIFDLAFQHNDLPGKIVVGLERIAEAFRVLLWDHAKVIGLSPIQIQILVFLAYHDESLCNVSHLAKEFNVTKATVSDAIKVLEKKKLIRKIPSPTDKRAYSIQLSSDGEKMVEQTESFANPIRHNLERLSKKEQEALFHQLTQLIYGLNQNGILQVQRTCFGCKFYEKKKSHHYCHLMNKKLQDKDLRLDCPEFHDKTTTT